MVKEGGIMKDVMLETLQRMAEWHARQAELHRVKAACAEHQKEPEEAAKHERARSGHLAYADAARWAIAYVTTKEKRQKRKAGPANAPDPDEAEAYAKEIGLHPAEVPKFMDHYGSNGWKVGKAQTPMADWRCSMRNWKRRNPLFSGIQPATPATTDPTGWKEFLVTEGQPYKPYRTAPEYLRIKFNDTRK
jgi:hypothetical protein